MFTTEQNAKYRDLVMVTQGYMNELIEVATQATEAILTDMDLHDRLTADVQALKVKADAASKAAIDYRNSVMNGTEE